MSGPDGDWHVRAERNSDQAITDIPNCSEHEAQFWTRNLVQAHADVTVTDPNGTIRRFSGS